MSQDQRLGMPDGSVLSETSSQQAQQALAAVYGQEVRPRCLCGPVHPQMYIAKVGGRFLVKRMPDTGVAHAVSCVSYLPPEHLSGLGQVLGHAIDEQPEADRTALRLGFPLSVTDRAAPAPPADPGAEPDTVATDGTKLTLRAVLHYLWEEAGLATWSPAMAGKRTWRVVSWHLREAAAGKYVKGAPLGDRLFIPQPWTKDRATDLKTARMQAWRPFQPVGGKTQKLLLLVGEVKEFGQARYGPKMVVKHLPDALITVPEDLMGRLYRRFGYELETWEADEHVHLMAIATCTVSRAGVATVREASLVLADRHWLPIDSPEEQVLVDSAVDDGRRFRKALRYNMAPGQLMASVVLTDTYPPTGCYLLTGPDDTTSVDELAEDTDTACWTWATDQPFPALPDRGRVVGDSPPTAAPLRSATKPDSAPPEGPPPASGVDGLWALEDEPPDLAQTPP